LFDSLTSALLRVADSHPLVLLVDDLHWADAPSLLLTRHVASAISDRRILIIGTYRESDIDAHHPLTALIAALVRLDAVQLLQLNGLAAAEVAGLVTATTGSQPADALVRVIMEVTAGNPFFVTQVTRMLAHSPQLDPH
jgi:predicted ATPase